MWALKGARRGREHRVGLAFVLVAKIPWSGLLRPEPGRARALAPLRWRAPASGSASPTVLFDVTVLTLEVVRGVGLVVSA